MNRFLIIKSNKMKKVVFLLMVYFSINQVYCQDFDKLISGRQMDCSDISYNISVLFVKYMKENKTDSAGSVIKYWQMKCGEREPMYRAKILLALKNGTFKDSLITEATLSHIFNYFERIEIIKYAKYYTYDQYKSYFGYIPPGQEFDNYTMQLARELVNNYDPKSLEYLLAEMYGDNSDTIFSKIQDKNYAETNLGREYYKTVERYVKMPEAHMSWVTGVWIPTGSLKKLGPHPEVGFQIGAKHRKMNYDLTLTFKFLRSANYYYARRSNTPDSPERTNHFFGGYIGFDIGRDLFLKNGHEVKLTGGLAADGFDALKENTEIGLKSASVWSYNFNAGLEYRYYINNTFYLGLRAKYNIVDYTLNEVIDFTGNPVTVQFSIGLVNNEFRNNNLKALKYRIRK